MSTSLVDFPRDMFGSVESVVHILVSLEKYRMSTSSDILLAGYTDQLQISSNMSITSCATIFPTAIVRGADAEVEGIRCVHNGNGRYGGVGWVPVICS